MHDNRFDHLSPSLRADIRRAQQIAETLTAGMNFVYRLVIATLSLAGRQFGFGRKRTT